MIIHKTQINYFKKITFILYLCTLCSVCCSCKEKDVEISLKNPTAFIFPCNVDRMIHIIKNNFNNQQFYGLSLANREIPLITKIFNDPDNYNDFILEEFSQWHKCKSKVYFNKKNQPYIYHATYQLHIEKITDNSTKVSIIVLESGIVYKTKLPVLPHLNRVFKLKELPPTTVEEYEILLIIGKQLKIEMPELKIPQKIIV